METQWTNYFVATIICVSGKKSVINGNEIKLNREKKKRRKEEKKGKKYSREGGWKSLFIYLKGKK